jgi:hypothetical protein
MTMAYGNPSSLFNSRAVRRGQIRRPELEEQDEFGSALYFACLSHTTTRYLEINH